MNTKRFDPVDELRPVPAGTSFSGGVENARPESEAPLAYDVYRVGEELCIDFDVPGVDPSSIRLAVELQFLTVAIERELVGPSLEVIERGRLHGSFERRLALPGQWDLDKLSATCENGVLHVQAPLRRSREPRMVALRTATRHITASHLQEFEDSLCSVKDELDCAFTNG